MKNKFQFFVFIVLAIISSGTLFAQGKIVTGKVISSTDRKPLPGVNIVVKGTTIGTVTDLDGKFSLKVSTPDAVLRFSYLGFLSKELKVGNTSFFNVILSEDIKSLNEVVVIGYGQIKKSNLTGSISSISSKELTSRPVTSLDMAVQGKAAGVQVSSTSGMPGANPTIRIRGIGSLGTSNAPLWVIDGYVGADPNSVAPEDIKSIEILKDAASTAIYGARGGNGVIIVTTKKGEANHNTITFSHYTQFLTVVKKMDVLNAPDFMRLRNQALANDGFAPQYTQDEIDLTSPVHSTGYIANTNWQDVMFKDALSYYFNVGISGGSKNTQYALFVNYKKVGGIMPFSNYKRVGVGLNISHKINKHFNLGANIKGYMSTQRGFTIASNSKWAYGPAGNAVVSLPIYPVYDSLGNYYTNKIWDNPLYAAEGDEQVRKYNMVQGNFYLNYSPIKNLNIKGTISGEARISQYTRFVTAGLNEATLTQNQAKGLIAQGNYYKWMGNIVATYNKQFGKAHHISAMFGIEQETINSNSHSLSGTKINKESLKWYDMGAFDPQYNKIASDYWESIYRSQFLRVSYNLLNKYLVMATVRRDGSSKFGPKKQYGIFPSVSVAWKMHHEKFISDIGVFSQLKLRASWGQSGNDQIALYQWEPEISYNVAHNLAVFGDNVVKGAIISKIPNANISWETSTTTDIGLDMSFFENRLNFTFDLYNRETTNLLWPDLLPLYTGYGDGWNTAGVSIWTNYAHMSNKGIEIGMNAIVIDKNKWKLVLDLNFAANKNKVLDMGGQTAFYVGITEVEVGKPIGNLYGYRTNGLYSIQDSVSGKIPVGMRPGDQKYVDINGDGVINDKDRTIIGNALPKFTGGLTATLTYKGWSLNLSLYGSYGNKMYDGTIESLSNGDLGRINGGVFLKNAWTHQNINSNIPRLTTSYRSLTSDRFVEDASFLKFTNFMLGYNFAPEFLKKIRVKTLQVYVSGQNLLTITKYRGFDPEVSARGTSDLDIGYDNKNYPTSRAFTVGLNFKLD